MNPDIRIEEIKTALIRHFGQIRKKFAEEQPYDLKRCLIYNSFKEIYVLNLEKITGSTDKEIVYNKLESLVKEATQLENKIIPESLNKLERNINEIELDVVRYFIEIYTVYRIEEGLIGNTPLDFEYYPEYYDPNFNSKIYSKKEFNKNKIPIITEQYIKKHESHGFEKSPTQKFVKNYISEYTPYNGLLLWHDVGVGKTCAGIGIAENFRDSIYSNEKKILILTPSDTLQQNWRDEIINIEKEISKLIEKDTKNVQCTGTKYTNELLHFNVDNPAKIRRDANKIINKYYEFFGYQKLAGHIKSRLAKNLALGPRTKFENKTIIEYIKRTFSNRVIIMDEVHVTRDSGTAKDKIAKPWIEMIVRYAENTKIVLLTATPMYNISREIIWLLNILLLNDKRAPIEEDDIFEKNGEELKEYNNDKGEFAINLLIKKSRGYISYLKGENPFTFPIKLFPNDKNAYTPSPKIDKTDNIIDTNKKIKNMVFYKNTLSKWQYKYVKQYTTNQLAEDSELLESDVCNSFAQKPTAASNIVFPLDDQDPQGEILGKISEAGFNNCFIENDGKYTLSSHVENINDTGNNFLHRDNLGTFSAKFHNIISSIQKCKGIAFVYSQFIPAGVLSLALALEANGFTRYLGDGKDDNLLANPSKDRFCSTNLKYESRLTDDERKKFTPARYILLTAKHTSVSSRNLLVKECRGTLEKPNTHGEHIKVILGTRVVEQGISFRRIREIHILDPWHHLNQMHQAEGRGFRYKSHMELKEEERNVTVYLHIGALPNSDKSGMETSDEYIYRRAYEKKINMANIEYILKKNAVDCELNKKGNLFLDKYYDTLPSGNPLTNKDIIDSQSKKRTINISDKDNSDKCNFRECDYKCYPEDINYDTLSINSDTFNDFFAEDDIGLIKEYIKTIFDKEWVYGGNQIVEIINQVTEGISKEYIYMALSEIIDNKEIVYDMYRRKGYIIDRDDNYIFQPYEFKDEHLPILYRYLHNINKLSAINLETHYKYSPKKSQSKALVKLMVKDKPLDANFDNIAAILREVYKNAHSFVNDPSDGIDARGYFDYPEKREGFDIKIPTRYDLVKCLFMSYIEKFPAKHNVPNHHELILIYVITSIINTTTLNSLDKTIIDIIIEYYDTPKTNSFIIRERDLYASKSDKIVGFRSFNKSYILYLSDRKNPAKLHKTDMQNNKQLKFNIDTDFPENNNLVYGFVEVPNKGGVARFNMVNKVDHKPQTTKAGDKSKKSDRPGAVCGTAMKSKKKEDLHKIINNILGIEKHYTKKEVKGAKEKTVHHPTKRNIKINPDKESETDFDKEGFKANLCQELELLLRYRELSDPNVNKNFRYFYKFEERLSLIDSLKKN